MRRLFDTLAKAIQLIATSDSASRPRKDLRIVLRIRWRLTNCYVQPHIWNAERVSNIHSFASALLHGAGGCAVRIAV